MIIKSLPRIFFVNLICTIFLFGILGFLQDKEVYALTAISTTVDITSTFKNYLPIVTHEIGPHMILASEAADGTQADQESWYASISAGGEYIAFCSMASNLVSGDENNASDIFVYERKNAYLQMISVSSEGVQGNDWSCDPSISADGRYVAYEARASNLVVGDLNNVMDVFVYDRLSGFTERVSLASNGTEGNGSSEGAVISANGRFVAFWSDATNLVDGDFNGKTDVFIHDREMGTTERVSKSSNQVEGNHNSYSGPMSADGRYVAFWSWASNLVESDTNGVYDVFVRDRITGQTEVVSVSTNGEIGNKSSILWGSMSADGRFVAFGSYANNLVIDDTNGTWDVFFHDRWTGETVRVSVNGDGEQGNGDSYYPSMSANGDLVTFQSDATNLVSGDNVPAFEIFLHNRNTGSTQRISISVAGGEGNSASYLPAISADGRFVAFESLSSNLVIGDTNKYKDIFICDR